MTAPLGLITDQRAEKIVAAVACDSPYGAQLADVHGVTPRMFHSPPLGRLYGAAVALVDQMEHEARVSTLANDAGVPVEFVVNLVHPARRPVMFDESGAWARRVIDAAQRREKYEMHVVALADLGIEVAA